MKRIVMKIREHFLPLIKSGEKKREYRLATPTRMRIKAGDVLVLVSNHNRDHYEETRVTGVHHFFDWNEALSHYGNEDFASLFSSKDEVLKELKKFYSHDEVQKYGVVVFDIDPIRRTLERKRVLLDTNIIIRREGFQDTPFDIARLYRWLDNKLHCVKLIHRETVEEIKKYKDEKVRTAIISKLNAYEQLPASAEIDNDFQAAVDHYKKDENSLIDNELLYEVYSGNADVLVTDDKLILEKAHDLFLDRWVMSTYGFLQAAEKEFPKLIDYQMLAVKKKKFNSLELNDPFFDSLKEDYPNFENWFKGKSEEEAYVFESKNHVHGFLYLKIETPNDSYTDIQPVFQPAKRLKVGTFKIDSKVKGFRLGERFIKIIFDNACAADVSEIYVTLFEGKRNEVDRLAETLKEWGFVYWGKKKGKESVYVKKLTQYDEEKSVKFNFPILKTGCRVFFLPIASEYHTNLFPDAALKNEDMSLYLEDKGHLYSLEKMYVTNMQDIKARPGDLLVVYRMGDTLPKHYSSVCTALAVFEEAVTPKTLEDYLAECKNKSIFTEEELKNFYCSRKYRTIVKMIFLRNYNRKITLKELREKGIVNYNSGPRLFSEIPSQDYKFFVEND